MEKKDLYDRAREAIIEANEELAMEIVDRAKEANIDLFDLLLTGFSSGNEEIGERFESGELSLPELIYAAEVMKNVTDYVLNQLGMDKSDLKLCAPKGRILLATVKGDIHDIGKGIVASALKAAGFEVIDIGCEVPVETIVEEAIRNDVDIIGTSALLTSTMTEQRLLEKCLAERGLKGRFMTMVGGAPCTPRWAKKIGASGYSEDANEAVNVALDLIRSKKDE